MLGDFEVANGALDKVLENYEKYLLERGAESAEKVKGNFNRYIRKPYPELCQKEAASITSRELLPPLEKLITAGKGPTALALRSQLYSAFQRAMTSENDPRTKDSDIIFGLQLNPVSKIPALSEFKNAGERALSEKELAYYVNELKMLPQSAEKDVLMVSLSLGGQRMEQLLRVNLSYIDFEGQCVIDKNKNVIQIATITLKDKKGRRKKPRNHVLPIVGYAESILSRLKESKGSNSDNIFVDKNGNLIHSRDASILVSGISDNLVAENKIKSPFKYADIRRTCETLLASYDVHKDIRAQIQSHGLSGVQNTHYDRYEYLLQKYEALTMWNTKLEELIANYVNKKEE